MRGRATTRSSKPFTTGVPPFGETLVYPSGRGVQYLSIHDTERLAEAGIEPSVGSRGDSYDNALAETVIGLHKTELIRQRGPRRGLDDVESPRSSGSTEPPPAEHELT